MSELEPSSNLLLPCPFCGASGLGYVLGGLPYDGTLDLEGGLGMVSSGIGYYAIRCRDCDCRGPNVKAKREQAVAKAIEAWNVRTLWT
jgi:hypothetical protein